MTVVTPPPTQALVDQKRLITDPWYRFLHSVVSESNATGLYLNVVDFGAAGDGVTDDTAALQAAIDEAIATETPLFFPAGKYNYTAPLTIDGNVSLIGAWVAENRGSGVGGVGINIPEGSPPLTGAVLCPTSNGSNGIDISGNALCVNIANLGISFQTAFAGTGHGINYTTGEDDQGLSASLWQNVKVYGHDGGHYGVKLENPIYNTFVNLFCYGGGVLSLVGTSTVWHYGNCVFIHLYGMVTDAGAAHALNLSASSADSLNLLSFVRPHIQITGEYSVTPPTTAQKLLAFGTNVTRVSMIAVDFEATVASPFEWNPVSESHLDYSGGIFPEPTYVVGNPVATSTRLPSGQYFQTGSSNNGSGTASISFGTAFPTTCYFVALTPTGPTQLPTVDFGTITSTGFDLTQAAAGTVYHFAYGS
jgi:hypothetical protein